MIKYHPTQATVLGVTTHLFSVSVGTISGLIDMMPNIIDKWASVAIARRLGYVKEGTERARNYNQYMKEYEDLTIFSKLRSEWKK